MMRLSGLAGLGGKSEPIEDEADGYFSQNETDDEAVEESEDDDDDSDASEDSVTRDLNSIGGFPRLRFPSFNWSTQVSGAAAPISRREQLQNLIEDLKSGFSLQSALDRFQTIRVLIESQVEETIQNNVDSDYDMDEDTKVEEPHVIKPAAVPRDIPMLDQVIIPQTKEPERKKKKKKRHHHHHGHHYSELHELATVAEHHKKDEDFLRKRIVQIRQLDIPEQDKNRLVQKLMMGVHYDKVRFVDENGDEVLQIDTKAVDDEDDDDDEEEEDEDLVILQDEDKQVTYHDEDEQVMGCPHYQRNCKMECPHCRKWFGCPKCHDEVVLEHKFKREKTRHVMCMYCSNVQEPTQFCDSCDAQFAIYFCEKCKLYDDDENKDIYHCDDCGICRLGLGLGQDFFHCKGCNACLSIELQNEHKCIERATQSDCPICGEYMFTSTKPVVFMQCGHAIHQSCFDDHSKHSYKCPSCQKTVLNMEAQFRVLDMEIQMQPLPEPYNRWTCIVTCNDCNAKSSSPYHVLGLKCDNCKSYNTAQVKVIKPEESDYESDISTTTNQLRQRLNGRRNLRSLPLSSHLLRTNYTIENVESDVDTDMAPKEDETEGERTLTIPQQLMNNFDQYLQNMGASSSEEEDDEPVDILRLGKTLKSSTSKFLSDSEDQAIPVPRVSLADTLRGFLQTTKTTTTTNDQDQGDDNDNDDDDDDDDEFNFNGF